MRTLLPVALGGVCLSLTVAAGEIGPAHYDPLAIAADFKPAQLDLTVRDVKRDRDIPVRVYLPANKPPAPVVLFGHGLGGTKDLAPIGQADMECRLGVYPALRGAPKYELVLHNAEHSAFTDRALPGDRQSRNPNHHRVILALSTAFWDAYLRGNTDAMAWLNGSGPRSVMEAKDRWQLSVK